MNITHRGQILTQVQLDALLPYCNGIMRGEAHNDEAIDRVLEAAGCPVTPLGASLAYAVFADNGNVACFSTDANHHSLMRLQAEGQHIVQLIDRQAYDAQLAELQRLRAAFTRFHHVVTDCERLASSYCGSIDGVEEHGGDDHEDPTCAIWHRLYYAEYDARRALAASAAQVKP